MSIYKKYLPKEWVVPPFHPACVFLYRQDLNMAGWYISYKYSFIKGINIIFNIELVEKRVKVSD